MAEQAPQRLQGKIKFYQIKSGYGFIIPVDAEPTDDNGVFVHRSAVYNPKYSFPHKGEIVEYEIVNDNSGRPKASNVVRPNARPFVKKTRPEGEEAPVATEKKHTARSNNKRRPNNKGKKVVKTDAEAVPEASQ